MTDSMLNHHLLAIEKDFVTQGGIKERMHSARTGFRKQQDDELKALRQKVIEQETEITHLKELLKQNNIL